MDYDRVMMSKAAGGKWTRGSEVQSYLGRKLKFEDGSFGSRVVSQTEQNRTVLYCTGKVQYSTVVAFQLGFGMDLKSRKTTVTVPVLCLYSIGYCNPLFFQRIQWSGRRLYNNLYLV